MEKAPKDRVISKIILSCNINNHISMLTHILVCTLVHHPWALPDTNK
jgi:hypothetical protein